MRFYLLDQHLTTSYTLLLHPADYETLAREYQQTYREALPSPYFLLDIYVEAATTPEYPVARHYIRALLHDERPPPPGSDPTLRPPH
ncbi:MAG: hypothetical protein ACRYFX_10285 [Janthinobacterium lividum]